MAVHYAQEVNQYALVLLLSPLCTLGAEAVIARGGTRWLGTESRPVVRPSRLEAP